MKRSTVGFLSSATALSALAATLLPAFGLAAVLFEDRLENYLTDEDAEVAGYQLSRLNQLDFLDTMLTSTGVNEAGTDWTFEFSRFRDAPLDANGNRTSAIGDLTKQPGENEGVFTGYVMSNSDFGDGNDDGDLDRGYVFTTPTFDASGAAQVWLEFATIALLNDGTTDSVFEIWVATDAGQDNWTRVFRRVPHDRQASPLADDPAWTIDEVGGLRGVFHVDLTAELAGQANASVRFVNRGAGDSWLISIDDIRVTDTAPGGSTVLLANETFDGTGALPAGWTTESVGSLTSPGWVRGNDGALTVTHHTVEGNAGSSNKVVVSHGPTISDYLIIDGDINGGANKEEYLITPNVTGITGPGVLYLEFNSEVRTNDDAQETIEISFDDGSTWESTPIFQYQKNVDGQEPAVHTHYVPVAITNQTQAKFRFGYETISTDPSGWWAIDDVAVTFESGAVAPVTPAVGGVPAQVRLDIAESTGVAGRTTTFGIAGLQHVRTEVQAIATPGDFNSPLESLSVTSGDLTSFTLPNLDTLNQTYQIRARHVATSIDGQPTEYFSEWSDAVSFEVVAPPDAPTFTAPPTTFEPVAAQNNGVTFDLGAFTSVDPGQTHTRTAWELIPAGGSFNLPILSGVITTGDLTTFTIPSLGIPEQDFTVRVRYEAGGLASAWTEHNFTVTAPAGLDLLLDEDFSGATLLDAVDENISFAGWTHEFPEGWVRTDANTGTGAAEWDGWALTNLDFWVAADDQDRSDFLFSTLDDGIFAVADGDEYDDFNGGGDYDSTLRTPFIAAGAGDVQIYYFYSYRFEAPGVAETFVRRGGSDATAESLIRFDSTGPIRPGDSGPSDYVNETQLHELNLTEDTNLFVEWRYYGEAPTFLSENDWWYAIDRVKVYGLPGEAPTSASFWSLYE